jgi:hypothetical protein
MDIQQTIEALVRESARHDEQIGELTRIMALQAIRQAEQWEKTQEQFRRTDEKIEKLGDRIDKLVSAISVMSTRLPGH